MKTRKQFFAALLGFVGIGKAQEQFGPFSVGCAARTPHPIFGCGKARNNQCPGCGQMAPPYKRKTEAEFYDPERVICLPAPSDGSTALSVCVRPSDTKLYGPKRVQVDGGCKRCNAAFWQDAE